MLEPAEIAWALPAGAGSASALLIVMQAFRERRLDARINSMAATIRRRARAADAYRAFVMAIQRAGWRHGPERLAAAGVAAAVAAGVVAGFASAGLVPLAFAAALTFELAVLNAAIVRRRGRLQGELAPFLELFTLELSAGGSPLSALGSVAVQVEGELAADLRAMLIASQVTGSASFASRLLDYADRIDIPALSSLATILGSSRDFGTRAAPGVRVLATDLRRAQRRELIAHSRRALNHVLLPAAATVLLPFLGVLLFPAVSVLQRSLR